MNRLLLLLLPFALLACGGAEETTETFSCEMERCEQRTEYCEKTIIGRRPTEDAQCKPISDVCPDGIPEDRYGYADPCACPGADTDSDAIHSCNFAELSSGKWEFTIVVQRRRP